MKRLIALLFLNMVIQTGNGQVVAIETPRGHQLYMCIDNHFKVAVENTPSKDLVLETDNGSIDREEDYPPGYYKINTKKDGKAVIYVDRKTPKGLKRIDSQIFWVKKLPCVAALGGKPGGPFSKSSICAQIAPQVYVANLNIHPDFIIEQFTVIVHCPCGQELFKRTLKNNGTFGARIDPTTNDFFTTLENGDTVLFTDFKIRNCDFGLEPQFYQPMVFTITEAEKYHKPIPGEVYELEDPVTGNVFKKTY